MTRISFCLKYASFSIRESLPPHDQHLVFRFCALISFIASGFVLAGWHWNVEHFKSVVPGLTPMNPLTAVLFMVLSWAIWIAANEASAKRAGFAGLVVASVGLSKYVSYIVANGEIFLDRILFYSKLGSNQIAPNTALLFTLIGASLFLTSLKDEKAAWIGRVAAAVCALAGWLGFLGYFNSLLSLYRVAAFIPMAMHTAVIFTILSFSCLFLKRYRLMPVLVVFLLGTMLSLLSFFVMQNWQADRVNAGLERVGRAITSEINHEIEYNLETLYFLRAFFLSSENVTRSEFAAFTRPIFNRHNSMQSLEWVPRVEGTERATFEAAVKADGITEFSLKERLNDQLVIARESELYYPALFIEPFEANEKALGLDYSKNPQRFETMQKAADSGEASMTETVNLLRLDSVPQSDRLGMFIFLPVYKEANDSDTVEGRRRNLRGFVTVLFRPSNIVRKSFVNLKGNLEVFNGDPVSENLFFKTHEIKQPDQKFIYKNTFSVANKKWHVVYQPDDVLINNLRGVEHWMVLLFSFLASVGFAFYCYQWVLRSEKIEKIVVERTLALDKAMKARSEFTSMVSHELRTPLTVIKESVGIVNDGTAGPINEEQADFLETARRNVDRLARLINNVLDFQKLEANHMDFHMKPEDLNQLVKETAKNFEILASRKNVKFKLNLAANLQLVLIDRDKIVQVLTNLVSNALKYSDNADIILNTEKQTTGVRISVTDQGPGISAANKLKLFKSFSQIGDGNERKMGGTGLGLAISKALVEAHRGTIGVESAPGKGSCFYFNLPYEQEKPVKA